MAICGNCKTWLAALIAVISCLLNAGAVFAERVTFIKEYNYQASEVDSKSSSRAVALEQVKRLLMEDLGEYLIKETEVREFPLDKDKITTLLVGIAAPEIIDDKWNGATYYLKARIKADPKEVVESLDQLRKDIQKSRELEEARKRTDEALRKIDRLKKELRIDREDKKKEKEYERAVNVLYKKEWFDKGFALIMSSDFPGAIKAYNKVIELDPEDGSAYYNRGIAYGRLGDYQHAVQNIKSAAGLGYKEAKEYLISKGIQ